MKCAYGSGEQDIAECPMIYLHWPGYCGDGYKDMLRLLCPNMAGEGMMVDTKKMRECAEPYVVYSDTRGALAGPVIALCDEVDRLAAENAALKDRLARAEAVCRDMLEVEMHIAAMGIAAAAGANDHVTQEMIKVVKVFNGGGSDRLAAWREGGK